MTRSNNTSVTNGQTAHERLARNTVIYFIGNAGSKLLQVLILPIITSLLLTSEYGYYDLIVTSINLVTPIVSFQLTEAMFRNLIIGSEEENKTILSSVAAFLLGGIVALAIVMASLCFFDFPIQYPILVFLNYVASVVFTYMQKVARSEQKNSAVAIGGVINTASMLGVQLLTLMVFGMRTDGMLIANFVSYFVAAVYFESSLNVFKRLSVQRISWAEIRDMLRISLPLVPNSVCWWFVSAGNSLIITTLISAAANGVYAIANAFSQMLTFVTGVFQMSWQESSIIESTSETRSAFYSSTFNQYVRFLLCAYITLLPFIRLVFPFLVAGEYQQGYLYVPILLASAVFGAFSQFYGSAYLAFKKTGGALSTTIIAAIINCGICILYIPYIGLFAPAIGSAAAFLAQWIFRIFQMKSYFWVSIDYKALLILIILSGGSGLLFYIGGTISQIFVLITGLVVSLIFNRKLIRVLLKKVGVVNG